MTGRGDCSHYNIMAADMFQKAGAAVTGFVKDAFSMNASLEKTTLQFTTLMGSADAASAH